MLLYRIYYAAAEPNEIKAFIFVVLFVPDSNMDESCESVV